MAEEKRCYRIVENAQKEVTRFENLAMKAIEASSDEDATIFLQEKAKYTENLANAQETHKLAEANAQKVRQMHDKLTNDINELKHRQSLIKANISVAKTQKSINKMGGGRAESALSKFDEIEQRSLNMLDRANAEAELNAPIMSDAEKLENKYKNSGTNVSDELAALKAKMNGNNG